MGTDPLGLCGPFGDLPCIESLKSAVGYSVGFGESGLHLAFAVPIMAVQQTRRGWQSGVRVIDAYQEGGVSGAFAEAEAINEENRELAKEQLLGLIPGYNTYRQGSRIKQVCEEEGSFQCGRHIGNTTFSLELDVLVVSGVGKGLQRATDLSGVMDEAVRGAVREVAKESRAPVAVVPETAAPGLLVDTDLLAQYAEDVPSESGGFLNVVTHADEEAAWVLRNGEWAQVSHRSLARYIEGLPEYRGQAIRLIACRAGSCSIGLAQNLANKLGVQVEAATSDVLVYPNGSFSAEGWQTFKPGGQQ